MGAHTGHTSTGQGVAGMMCSVIWRKYLGNSMREGKVRRKEKLIGSWWGENQWRARW